MDDGINGNGVDFRLRINAFKPKDAGLYTCNQNAKEMNIRIRLKRNSPQDLEGKFDNEYDKYMVLKNGKQRWLLKCICFQMKTRYKEMYTGKNRMGGQIRFLVKLFLKQQTVPVEKVSAKFANPSHNL